MSVNRVEKDNRVKERKKKGEKEKRWRGVPACRLCQLAGSRGKKKEKRIRRRKEADVVLDRAARVAHVG